MNFRKNRRMYVRLDPISHGQRKMAVTVIVLMGLNILIVVIVGFHVLSFLHLKLPLKFLDFFLFH